MSNLDEGETTTAQIDVVATLPSQEDAVESPDISLPPTPSLTSAFPVQTIVSHCLIYPNSIIGAHPPRMKVELSLSSWRARSCREQCEQ
ncbi:hypothetical protein O3P69_018342 [Scylla paramamosain]|uniref:Uncharacterized protein n=1 Tax=Scylla paramamosain TaxID=85552 RepID=A0AAW0SB84_SCYPA